ncbi:hypothetical protein MBM09_08355 [Flaviramulus sp. BrNp1-15]|uniref:hypothetical protein n=1 Tax=Flaviramulus sp. BrNp1-15 TaxID=2916754 RepID=UPI001EE7B24E|nr:hypothetical protein [Flaviramulus sp. BrNp1-15]ULC57931.1 hypothetical protein MBM09_08355 [Flaviramulus sp. BrNp1-15]
MKNKTKTYVLLAAVLGIWGVVGYKIISTINPPEPEIVTQNFDMAFSPNINTQVDTFSIQKVNRDPFLGTFLGSNKKKSTQKTSNKSKENWVPVIYHGSISKQNTKNKVFIVSINGQQYPMKMGQSINEVKLIKGNSDNILVSYKGERKTIAKT